MLRRSGRLARLVRLEQTTRRGLSGGAGGSRKTPSLLGAIRPATVLSQHATEDGHKKEKRRVDSASSRTTETRRKPIIRKPPPRRQRDSNERKDYNYIYNYNDKTKSILEALSTSTPVKKMDNPKTMAPPSTSTTTTTTATTTSTTEPPTSQSFFSEVEAFLDREKPAHPNAQGETSTSATTPTTSSTTRPTTSSMDPSFVPKKSIFDVFKVPEPAPTRSENAFDEEACQAYQSILDLYLKEQTNNTNNSDDTQLTLEQRQSVHEWMRQEEPQVKVELPLFSNVCLQGKDEEPISVYGVETELQTQANKFRNQLNWNTQQYKYATTLIHEVTHFTHTHQHKALPIVVLWHKMQEAGYMPKKTISVCLEAATSFAGGVLARNRSSLLTRNRLLDLLHNSNSNSSSSGSDTTNVPEQLAFANDLLYKPTQQSTSIRTRRLISLGESDMALQLIQARMTGEAKLRAYAQVFSLYLELRDIGPALALLDKMKKGHKQVPIQPELLVQLVAAAAEKGCFCHDAEPIDNISDRGFSTAGPALLDQLAREMALYVDSISSASAKRLQKAFQRGFQNTNNNNNIATDASLGDDNEIDVSALAPLKPLPRDRVVPDTDLVADRVTIDTSNGYCFATGTSLRLIDLEREQKNRLKQGLLHLVGRGNLQSKNSRAMEEFWKWLGTRTGPRFTVIVDGANVAYYMQNFDRGRFNYSQIEFVVAALESHGEFPLVLLPQRYLNDVFTISAGGQARRQSPTESDRAIIDRLRKTDQLYACAQGSLDDYFWISATVIDQAKADAAEASGGHAVNRLSSGAHPVVITNDQIRDHKEYDLLEAKAFHRWYSNTIVNYNFTGFVGDDCVDPEIVFTPADRYSNEIQGNKAGGDDDKQTNMAWHIPVHDWETSDWFCIRLPNASSTKGKLS